MPHTTSFKWAALLLAGLIVLGTAGSVMAQSEMTTARVTGTVKDSDGGVLPGATVEARNQETGLVLRAVTDGRGFFRLLNLPPGPYTMSCEMPGFATASRSDVRLVMGSAPSVDFTMQLSSVAETITVTSDVPLVEVHNTAAATTVQTEQIAQLPSAGRNYTNLILLTPETGNRNERGYLTIGGQRGINTAVSVDGMDYNNAFFGGPSGGAEGRAPLSISQESIKEFSVITNGASAEYGRSGGGMVTLITKSGTNTLRGGVFYFVQPNDMVAKRRDGVELDKQDKVQLGGSLGGAIIKDKLFFFTSYDRQDQERTIIVNPALLNAGLAAKYPALASGPSYVQTQDGQVVFGRFDLQTSASHRFTFRASYTDYEGINGTSSSTNNASNSNGIEGLYSRNYVFSYSGMFGDSVINDLNMQYQREDTPRQPIPETANFAQIRIGNYFYGGTSFLPIVAEQYRKAIANTLTYMWGDHVFKGGFDYNDTGMDQIFKGNWRGVYRFYNFDDFLAGKWWQYYQFGGLNGLSSDQAGQFNQAQKEYAAFIQDQWFITSNFTVTLGLRWENLDNPNDPVLNPNERNANGSYKLNGKIADQKNQLSPRLGVNWSPDGGKSVLRFSAGRFWSRTPSLLFSQLYTSNGLAGTQYTIDAPTSGGQVTGPPTNPLSPGWGNAFGPGAEAINFALVPNPTRLGVFVMDPDFKNPRTDRVTLGFDREIFRNTAISIDATWAEATNLQRMTDYNLAYARNPDGSIKLNSINGMPEFSSTRPNPYYGRVSAYVSDARSQYLAIAAVINRRFTESFFGFLSVTYSKDKDNDSNERNFAGFQVEDPYNLKNDWGYSVRDQRWKFALNSVWNTPWWGVSLSGTYRYITGAPFSATTQSDANRDGFTNDRPTINGVHQERNSFRFPDFSSLDLRLQKAFKIGPTKLALMADCFNCTNNANRGISNTIWGNAQTPAASFGVVNTVTGFPRTFQLGVRLDF